MVNRFYSTKAGKLMFKVVFENKEDRFFTSLRTKVNDFFSTRHLRTTGNLQLYLKAVFILSTAIALYMVLVFYTPPYWLAIILCALLGLNLAAIGFNIMHDAAHGSFSSSSKVNNFLAYSLNFIGGNILFWKLKHNVYHHTYTNIEEMDEDIDLEPWMRVHTDQPKRWYHRFQHIYWVVLYSVTYLMWVFGSDFKKYFSGKISGNAFKKLPFIEHFLFWTSKLAYIAIFLLVPAYEVGVIPTLVGYLVMSGVCGFTIAIIFQLAHLTEYAETPSLTEKSDSSGKVEQLWAVHEVQTTADFATKNRFIIWITGGLNFQVEHHLFPRISHVYYPQLRQLVKQTCEEFRIGYKEFPSFWSAVRSHVLYLKRLGSAGSDLHTTS